MLTKTTIESVYPEVKIVFEFHKLFFYHSYISNTNYFISLFISIRKVFESYTIQLAIPEAKYEEKLKFWEQHGINCFERWTVPYFMERERERKRPCLRLNYPPDGKCNDCVKGIYYL